MTALPPVGDRASDGLRTRYLTALPVFNECNHVNEVLDQVVRYATDVLVVDDGSTDCTRQYLSGRDDVEIIVHPQNRGYGAALRTAFEYAIVHRYDVIVTVDCDGQHEPQRIEQLVAACEGVDIASGSRYLNPIDGNASPPADRRRINHLVTAELNRRLGFHLTDAFCGFKAYRVRSLAQLELVEDGYAMPLELWVQAAAHGLQVEEVPIPLIYLDEDRSFGGVLDDADTRLAHYVDVIDRAVAAVADDSRLALEVAQHHDRLPCL